MGARGSAIRSGHRTCVARISARDNIVPIRDAACPVPTPRGHLAISAPNIPRSRTFIACSLGLRPPELSQVASFRIGTSCRSEGDSTATLNCAAIPGEASVRPQRRNSTTASAAASYSVEAATCAVWVMPSESVKDTRQLQTGTSPW
jgi:hypothetical protein